MMSDHTHNLASNKERVEVSITLDTAQWLI